MRRNSRRNHRCWRIDRWSWITVHDHGSLHRGKKLMQMNGRARSYTHFRPDPRIPRSPVSGYVYSSILFVSRCIFRYFFFLPTSWSVLVCCCRFHGMKPTSARVKCRRWLCIGNSSSLAESRDQFSRTSCEEWWEHVYLMLCTGFKADFQAPYSMNNSFYVNSIYCNLVFEKFHLYNSNCLCKEIRTRVK